jgi:hypothetical protein
MRKLHAENCGWPGITVLKQGLIVLRISGFRIVSLYVLKSLHPLLYLFFPFLDINTQVEINSLCHHKKLFTLVAKLLVGAFIKQRGVLKTYERTNCEDSALIGIGNVPTPQVLKDGVRLNRWTSSKFYPVYTNFAKIGKLIYRVSLKDSSGFKQLYIR